MEPTAVYITIALVHPDKAGMQKDESALSERPTFLHDQLSYTSADFSQFLPKPHD